MDTWQIRGTVFSGEISYGCSELLLTKDERPEDFAAVREWWFRSYETTGAGRPLLEEAVLNEWLLKRTQRAYLAMDSRLNETNVDQWTDEQINRLGVMLRYKGAAERSFHRSVAAVERFRRARLVEEWARQRANLQAREHERRRRQEEDDMPDPEPNLPELVGMLPPLPKVKAFTQWVNVKVVDGKTVTTMQPTNEQLLADVEAAEEKPGRVFRKLLVRPMNVPEYAWMSESLPGRTEAREQIMQFDEWLRALEREKADPDGHVGPVEKDPTWKNLEECLKEMEDAKQADGPKKERAKEGARREGRRPESGAGTVGGSSDPTGPDGNRTDPQQCPTA